MNKCTLSSSIVYIILLIIPRYLACSNRELPQRLVEIFYHLSICISYNLTFNLNILIYRFFKNFFMNNPL